MDNIEQEFVLPDETTETIPQSTDFSADFQLPEEFDLPAAPTLPEEATPEEFLPPTIPEEQSNDFGFSEIPEPEPLPESFPEPEQQFSYEEATLPEPEPIVDDALT